MLVNLIMLYLHSHVRMHDGLICIAFHMSGRLSVIGTKVTRPKNQISATVQLRVLKFGQNIDVDDPKVDLEDQGHRSNVKVTGSKNIICGVA